MEIDKILKKEGPPLSLLTKSINGWYMASCPEFEVMAWGNNEKEACDTMYKMIKTNCSIILKKRENKKPVPIYLMHYARIIKRKKDISYLFRLP